jgi:hypothetical protein
MLALGHGGRLLRITHRGQGAFHLTGLTWIARRNFAWLGRNRRLGKDYEDKAQTSATLIEAAPPSVPY